MLSSEDRICSFVKQMESGNSVITTKLRKNRHVANYLQTYKVMGALQSKGIKIVAEICPCPPDSS